MSRVGSRRQSSIFDDDDDPFLAGSTCQDIDEDPFVLAAEEARVRKNLLPPAELHQVFNFCDAPTLVSVAQVNRAWLEETQSEKLWKHLCKEKYGSDVIRECRSHVKILGYKLTYFVGICKTMLVNTPDKHAVALVPYPGLTIRDMLRVLGVDKPTQYQVNSTSFSEDFSAELEDLEEKDGCAPVANTVLCDVLSEPFANIYVEALSISNGATRDDDDEPGEAAKATKAEAKVKQAWVDAAIKSLKRYPTFVQQGMSAHWPSLCPARPKQRRSIDETQLPGEFQNIVLSHKRRVGKGLGPPDNSPTMRTPGTGGGGALPHTNSGSRMSAKA
jgi:hypothetical protein|mmetsp:Transcript_11813/g.21577  ORF Transcript_11813/g.21577 Transcript_11813/m.21577 type:complete len:331 (+) Transcript_11813:31-1023(+)